MDTIVADKLRAKACDVCGETDAFEVLGRRRHRVPKRNAVFLVEHEDTLCLSCGFLFNGRVPNEGFLFSFYAQSHTNPSEPDFDVNARLAVISRYLKAGSSLLELGAAEGRFCAVLNEAGYRACGVDPVENSESGAIVRASAGGAPDSTFDAVVSYYVLEHVLDGREFLRIARSRLKRNGLLIVEVPFFPTYADACLTFEHQLHFTPEHLGALARRSGFSIVELGGDSVSRPFGMVMVARSNGGTEIGPNVEALPLIEQAREAYQTWIAVGAERDRRLAALIRTVEREPTLYVWGMNMHATQFATVALASGLDPVPIDRSPTKIGQPYAGFQRLVQAPQLAKRGRDPALFVICSGSWGAEIAQDIHQNGPKDARIMHLDLALKAMPDV